MDGIELAERPPIGGATSCVFDAGDPLTCIAVSSFFPLIAIAGRNLLQVLRVDGDQFVSVGIICGVLKHQFCVGIGKL